MTDLVLLNELLMESWNITANNMTSDYEALSQKQLQRHVELNKKHDRIMIGVGIAMVAILLSAAAALFYLPHYIINR